MTGITNFFGNGTIKFGKVVIEESYSPFYDPLFGEPVLLDSFEVSDGWEPLPNLNAVPVFTTATLEDSFEVSDGYTINLP